MAPWLGRRRRHKREQVRALLVLPAPLPPTPAYAHLVPPSRDFPHLLGTLRVCRPRIPPRPSHPSSEASCLNMTAPGSAPGPKPQRPGTNPQTGSSGCHGPRPGPEAVDTQALHRPRAPFYAFHVSRSSTPHSKSIYHCSRRRIWGPTGEDTFPGHTAGRWQGQTTSQALPRQLESPTYCPPLSHPGE